MVQTAEALKVVQDGEGAVPTAREADLAGLVRARLITGISQNRAAREIGVAAGSLSAWLTGNYGAGTEAIEVKVKRWLNLSESREMAMIPARPAWIETPTARRIAAAFDYAQSSSNMAVVHGGAGVGKTCTARAYAKRRPNVWLINCAPSTGTLIDTLDEVAYVLGEKGIKGRPAHYRRALLERLRGTRGLLIIDEAQELCLRAVNELIRLGEDSETGIVLMGNDEVYSRMTGGTRAAAYARIFSRIAYRVRLSSPKPQDVELILDAWKMTDPAARKVAREAASQGRGLHSLSNVVALATSWSRGGPVTPGALYRAIKKTNDDKPEE